MTSYLATMEAIAGRNQDVSVLSPTLLAAVVAAQKRGVKVRVMLNPACRGGEPENVATRRKLEKAAWRSSMAIQRSPLRTRSPSWVGVGQFADQNEFRSY